MVVAEVNIDLFLLDIELVELGALTFPSYEDVLSYSHHNEVPIWQLKMINNTVDHNICGAQWNDWFYVFLLQIATLKNICLACYWAQSVMTVWLVI